MARALGRSAWGVGARRRFENQQIDYQRRLAEATRGPSRPQIDYSGLLADTQKREADALAANRAREAEIRGGYDAMIGEGFGAARTAGLAEIEQGKTRAVGAGMQQMVSSGMFGTTTAASIPIAAENQASLSRLKLEDILTQRTQELKLGKLGFIERIEEPYPDYSMLFQAMLAQGQG